MPSAPIKLFVDDLRPPPDSTWTVARNVEDAIAHLAGGKVSYASFDHDMGEPPCDVCVGQCAQPCPHHCHEAPKSGTDLINWMVRTNTWPTNRPTVHSSNPERRHWMESMIEQHGPYSQDGHKTP